MFAKKLLHKAVQHHSNFLEFIQHNSKFQNHGGLLQPSELDPRIVIHYGIPSTASVLAFDPIQRLLAIGTLDGRLKVIGGDNIEGLLISPKQLPYKHLEFLQNQGHLVGVLNDNDIQVWSLESRSLVCSLQWESNITAFSITSGSHFIYVGDEHGSFSVVKFEAEEGQLLKSSNNLSAKFLREAAGFLDPSSDQPIVGILPQPSSFGNRLLIAFQDGLLILWDVSEAKAVFLGGGKDLQLKDHGSNSSNEHDSNIPADIMEQNLGDKEISALCWASSTGSVLAVGYLDGDILFWNLSSSVSSKGQQTYSSKNVVKLQLSSAERRLPVIVLQWSNSNKSRSDCDGQLFVYGGDEIGSEEVLTVLTLEWSSGMETVNCISRADLTLSGSFADLILLRSAGAVGLNSKDDLFVLTNPGQLHFYDSDNLSALTSQQKRTPSVSALEFPVLVPMADPSLTVAKLVSLSRELNSSKILAQVASVLRNDSKPSSATDSNWPLTGGVPCRLSRSEGSGVERVYFVGYSDGSVLVCDATHPVLSYICYIEGEVKDIKVAGSSSPVTKLDFSSVSLRLAVGNESGLVRIYDLKGRSDGANFHFVTETKHEVHDSPQGKGPHCIAVFGLLGSPVQALSFSNSGTKLAVGLFSGRVAVCDMTSFAVLFLIDGAPSSSSPITSMIWKEKARFQSSPNSSKQSETSGNSLEELIFVLPRDGKINVVEGDTGKTICSRPLQVKESTAISMYVIEDSISASEASNDKQQEEPLKNNASPDEPVPERNSTGVNSSEDENSSSEITTSADLLLDPLVLLCCENSLRLFSAKSLIQGNKKPIRKVKHSKSYYWTTILKKEDKFVGLLLLLQTGTFEIRSLPDLELVAESSLLSILRWNYKVNMEKTMCSDDNGNIVLSNGSELAFISLLAGENEFRSLEHLPCLHDKVVAAAADAAFRFSSTQKKKQITGPGILGGIVKGLKGGKSPQADFTKTQTSTFAHLDDKFFKSPLPDSHQTVADDNELELDIDDIEIDEPTLPKASASLPKASTSSPGVKTKKKDKLQQDREKLFEGGTSDDVKPRVRTPEEIMAAYRKTGDASSAAAQARNKLMERQERLERMSQRTAELQSGAEEFASLANELVKTMERRKWWQI